MRSRTVTKHDAALARALIGAGILQSDIAALLQCNAGRIAEIHTGQRFPGVKAADLNDDATRAEINVRISLARKRIETVFSPLTKGSDR